MNLPLLTAGLLSLITAFLHGGIGEVLLIRRVAHKNVVSYQPMRRRHKLTALARKMGVDESAQIWRYLQAGWHFLTINLLASGVILIVCAYKQSRELALIEKFIAMEFAGHTVVWLWFVAMPQKINVVRAPQWLLVGAIAVLTWIGSSR